MSGLPLWQCGRRDVLSNDVPVASGVIRFSRIYAQGEVVVKAMTVPVLVTVSLTTGLCLVLWQALSVR